MRILKRIALFLAFLLISISPVGCWNYRELDEMAVVAGVAIDKGVHEKYSITVEIAETTFGKESQVKSKILTIEGKTIFDAVRHNISISGKRLYWSHAKVAIISKEMAEEGVVQVLDWFNRDAETRSDIHILVSKAPSAREVLLTGEAMEEVAAFVLEDVISNQKSLSNAPEVQIWKFANVLAAKGVGSIATAVELDIINGKKIPHVMGTAVFKNDRLIGFIDGEETKYMLFLQDELKGGILVAGEEGNGKISLEIFKSKTKVSPSFANGQLEMNVQVETTAAIDEIGETKDVIEEEELKKLQQSAENNLKKHIHNIIRKAQWEYGVDIFGFGEEIRQNKPKIWKSVSEDWEQSFKNLKVNVETKIHIKNSAMLAEPLEVGE